MDFKDCPVEYMAAGMERYVRLGIEPGGFMKAVLCNDLHEAVSRADATNQRNLAAWVKWCYNNLPNEAWGSPERYSQWVKKAGQCGQAGREIVITEEDIAGTCIDS